MFTRTVGQVSWGVRRAFAASFDSLPYAWVVLLLLTFLLRLGPALVAPTLYNDDARTFTYPFWKDRCPASFPGDPMTDYIREALMPPGYRVLFGRLVLWSLHPLIAMNLAGVALVVLATASVFVCSYRFGGTWAGGLAAALHWQSGLSCYSAGATPRAFCLPLLGAGLACWLWRKERSAAVVALLASWLYPPAYALLAVTSGLRLLRDGLRVFTGPWDLALFVLIHLLAVGSLMIWMLDNPYGRPMTGRAALSADPRWSGPHPRLTWPSPREEWARTAERAFPIVMPRRVSAVVSRAVVWPLAFGALSALALTIRARRAIAGRHRLTCLPPTELLPLTLSVVILYTLARLDPMRLYQAERYLWYGLGLVFFIGTAGLTRSLVTDLVAGRPRRLLVLRCLAVVVVGLSLRVEWRRGPSEYGFTATVPRASAGILRAVAHLPADSLVLSPGDLAEDVPLLSARPVVWNRENYIPFHRRYVQIIDGKIRGSLEALLASDWPSAQRRLQTLGVTHLVYEGELWRAPEERPSILLSPLREEYGPRLAGARGEELVWDHIPPQNTLYDDGRYKLVTVNGTP